MAIVYNGKEEISLSAKHIIRDITIEQAVAYYQPTEIYYSVVKEQYNATHSHLFLLLLEAVRTGRELLFERMVKDLGEDRACMIAADISMKIKLAE